MNKVSILGAGCYVPETIITNDDLSKVVDTSDEWITTRTGIRERHLSNGEATYMMGAKAAKAAIKNAGITPSDVDMIICATITPDEFMPSTACRIQSEVGATNAVAFDISAACSGLVFATSIATQFIKTGMYKNICVVGAETLSKVTDWSDRGTCVLFGDGAGAMIIGQGNGSMEILSESMMSNGDKGDVLTLNAVPFGNLIKPLENIETDNYMKMDGQEVFKFAVKVIAEQVKKVANKADIEVDDIDMIVPHQANVRIIETAAKLLSMDVDKFYVNLDKYGNTSSATIGIAMAELFEENKLNKGDNLVMTGFGGGLSAGAILVRV